MSLLGSKESPRRTAGGSSCHKAAPWWWSTSAPVTAHQRAYALVEGGAAPVDHRPSASAASRSSEAPSFSAVVARAGTCLRHVNSVQS